MTEKSLIIIFSLLFATSSAFLFWQNTQELDPNQGKSWWTLSFADPKNESSLAFTIVNHSNHSTFTYEATYVLTQDKIITSRDSVNIASGEAKTITPDLAPHPELRTTITVTAGTETQEIYR